MSGYESEEYGSFECPICGYANNSKKCFYLHLIESHSPSAQAETRFPCAWVSFASRMPMPAHDRKIVGPTHGAILVTNSPDARNRWGAQSHVWLASMVHPHPTEVRDGSYVEYEAGEITAFADGDMIIHRLTHWRPAVPEEWEYDANGLPTHCIVSDPNN